MTINYIDALAGRGKTEYIIQKSVTLAADEEKVLILVPQVTLCEEVMRRMQGEIDRRNLPEPIDVKTIHHQNSGGSVVGAIINHIKNNEDYPRGEILILTMAAYDLMNWRAFPLWVGQRHLFVDEIPPVERFYNHKLPVHHDLITQYMQTIPSEVPGYSYVTCSDIDEVKEVARNRKKDEVVDIFQPLAHLLSSKHWVSYVQDEHHSRLSAGKTKRLQVHSLRQPETFAYGWKRVVIGGALFRDSLLYQMWSRQEVKFVEETTLPGPSHHNGGDLITFQWALPGQRMTKYRHDNIKGTDGEDFIPAFCQRAAKMSGVANNEIMFLSNKGMDDQEFRDATRLPASPYGTNDYRHYRHFVATGAFNQNPHHERFLMAATGLNTYRIWRATHFSVIYQGMMRGAPRNLDNDQEVIVSIPDQQTVWNLKPLFPGSRDVGMGMEQYRLPEPKEGGRPKKWEDDAERKRAERKQTKIERIMAELQALNEQQL